MCGVIAYQSERPKPEDFKALARVFGESRIRGQHAFGIAWEQSGSLFARKFHRIDEMERLLIEELTELPKRLIGHTRYSTSGDFLDHRNNQPLHLESNFLAMVFNGVIDQSPPEIWPAKYRFQFSTENDGEIAMRYFLAYGREGFEKWFAAQKFSFAGAFLNSSRIHIIRNKNRPLWVTRSGVARFFASTKDILARSEVGSGALQVNPFEWISL